jgi:large subunit ribosomal protein L29
VASIVELREMSDKKVEEMLENAREEMFNLRFQHASARLDDLSRLRTVRREIAQLETVLRMRELAVETALRVPEVAQSLAGKKWEAAAHFSYEDSAWVVEFTDEKNGKLATQLVDLNKKRPSGRKARRAA